ncbi:MAG: pilus assembly PilX N-terminal domain-containing protein [Candidatus Eisenbacteria bacterium]|nr:pilus assembly PilX N-terminal domain-containing protein [Candidatus Eisenbacteria bacterium]
MRPSPSYPRESGFVLIGVVMFVLALTIIGISLFGLSSYEAQFFSRSEDQTQAFFVAQGGIQRAMFAISWSDSLGTVMGNLPPGVTYAVAMQDKGGGFVDSTGPVAWGDPTKPVVIRATARVGDATRTLQARYFATEGENYYKRLLTSTRTIVVSDTNPDYPTRTTCGTVALNGNVWLGGSGSAADSSWMGCVGSWSGSPPVEHPPAIPTPEVTTFLAAHPGGSTPEYKDEGNTRELKFKGTPGNVKYYRGPTTGSDFTFHEDKRLKVEVKGYAIWMLEKGARFDQVVDIKGEGEGENKSCLVIIAAPGQDSYGETAGVWFFGGIRSSEIPVILVSNDKVIVEHHFNPNNLFGYANDLSIFARDILIMGPLKVSPPDPQYTLTLTYTPETLGPLIDLLSQRRALPNATDTGYFTLDSGSWQELTP